MPLVRHYSSYVLFTVQLVWDVRRPLCIGLPGALQLLWRVHDCAPYLRDTDPVKFAENAFKVAHLIPNAFKVAHGISDAIKSVPFPHGIADVITIAHFIPIVIKVTQSVPDSIKSVAFLHGISDDVTIAHFVSNVFKVAQSVEVSITSVSFENTVKTASLFYPDPDAHPAPLTNVHVHASGDRGSWGYHLRMQCSRHRCDNIR